MKIAVPRGAAIFAAIAVFGTTATGLPIMTSPGFKGEF